MSKACSTVSLSPDVVDQIGQLIKNAQSTGQKASAWDKIQDLMLQHGLAWRMHLPPEMVGTHKKNRSGLGISGFDAHVHGVTIVTAGFSWRKASDAVAVEVADTD